MTQDVEPLFHARRWHDALPPRIRSYLHARGIPDSVIDIHRVGWNGQRITIPIFDRDGRLAFFKLAKDPEDPRPDPKMITPAGSSVELYGWERVCVKPPRIVICEGEFDRLVLEGQGIAAVTSTGGAGVFRADWAEILKRIPEVYLCFDRDEAGRRGAARVAELLPHARIVDLPHEVGEGGDVTDYFVLLRHGREGFLKLLEEAKPAPVVDEPPSPPPSSYYRPRDPVLHERTERLKREVPIEEVIVQYVALRRSGRALRGICLFHEDHVPSLMVYPERGLFRCFGCEARGDVIAFVQRAEKLSFREALETLEHFHRGHDGKAA